MKSLKLFTFILLIQVTGIIFFCCDSNELVNNSPGTNVVSGSVLSENGHRLSNAMVSLNYQTPIPVTPEGRFSFSEVSTSYDLILIVNNTKVYVYTQLSSYEPTLYTLNDDFSNTFQNQAYLVVTSPAKLANQHTRIRFLSNMSILMDGTSYMDTIQTYYLKWSGNVQSANGKLVIMRYSESGGTIQFDNFGFKDTVIENGGVYLINFSASDMSFNPPESSVRMFFPPGEGSISASLIFSGYPLKSNSLPFFHEYFTGSSRLVIVPGMLPVNFNIKLIGSLINSPIPIYFNVNLNPNGLYTLPQFPPVNLITPEDDTTGVTFGTHFSHDGTAGVFITTIKKVQSNFTLKIISDKNSVYFPPLQMFGIFQSGEFDWYVQKYNGISNIDDFCDGRVATNYEGFSAIISSTLRHFHLGSR